MSNTIHDMGGMHGFGPVEPEADEPIFHTRWEARVRALTRAVGATGLWTIDATRAAMEVLPPATYLAASYYERWFLGMERRLVDKGLVGTDELAAGHSLREPAPIPRKLAPADAAKPPIRGEFERPTNTPARFKPGDRVRTKNLNPATHTRLPRYARDKEGLVEAVRGCHVYPDTAAIGEGEHPQWLYTVVFTGKELWGDAADPAIAVSVEAFEPYLSPV